MISPYLNYGDIVWTSTYELRIKCLTILKNEQ